MTCFFTLTLGSLGYEVKQRSWFQAHLQKPAIAAACTRRSALGEVLLTRGWLFHGNITGYSWNMNGILRQDYVNVT